MKGWLIHPGTTWWRGSQGVKPGIRIVMFIIVMALIMLLIELLIGMAIGIEHALHHAAHGAALPKGHHHINIPSWITEAISIIAVIIATQIMTYLENRPFWTCYLNAKKRVTPVLIGLGCGILALSVLIGLLLVTGHAQISFHTAALKVILGNGLFQIFLAFLIGFNEEFLFRGYLQQTFKSAVGFWVALILTSAIFCIAHLGNPNENIIGIASVFGAGVVLCIGLRQTGALWWSIGFHAGWDFSEDFLFGTHDSGLTVHGALLNTIPHGATWLSGGMVGPEGSIFSLLVELIAAILLLTLWRRSAMS